MLHTTLLVDGTFVDIPCGSSGCNTTGPENTACFPIPVPEDDPNYTDRTCLKFVRTQEVMPLNCEQGMRKEQKFYLINFNNHVYFWLEIHITSFVQLPESSSTRSLRGLMLQWCTEAPKKYWMDWEIPLKQVRIWLHRLTISAIRCSIAPNT